MVKKSKNIKSIRAFLVAIIALLLAGLAGIGVNISLQPSEEGYTSEIEFSEEQRTLLNKIAELIAEYLTYELADIREHDGALVAQCKKAGLSGYEKELYNALVA